MARVYPPLPGPYRVGAVDIALTSERDETQARAAGGNEGAPWQVTAKVTMRRVWALTLAYAGVLPALLSHRRAAGELAGLAAQPAVLQRLRQLY